VADYRPVHVSKEKIKKGEGQMSTLELERTKDILGSVRDIMGFQGVLVGFAAETENIRENALNKLNRKGCDVLFANDVSRSDIGFDCKENEMTVYFATGDERSLARAAKVKHGKVIIDICTEVQSAKQAKLEASKPLEAADA
jgi:phosphopantothenoylcysteine synthetase/decarboxylase